MSGRRAHAPSSRSAGGHELHPCEVKSSRAHGPEEVSRAAAGSRPPASKAAPASDAPPAIKARRLGREKFDMFDKMSTLANTSQSTNG